MNDTQKIVLDFNKKHNLHMDAVLRLLDLQTELGELSKEHLKLTDYGRSNFTKGPEWKAELGDLAYSLLALANETEVDIDEALDETLVKYAQRIERGKNPGSSGV